MADKSFSNELGRALARTDADELVRQIDIYIEYKRLGAGDWPDDIADDLEEILYSGINDPEKAMAYVMIAAARTDDPSFLGFMGCGPLEDVRSEPSTELLERIVAEARKSGRFRWLLSNPFKVAIDEQAWDAIAPFRITGPHEEPTDESLPPRNYESNILN